MISHIICNSVEGTRGYFEQEGKERQEDCFSHSSFISCAHIFIIADFQFLQVGFQQECPAYFY
jgi:hypothetical protein